MVTALTGNTALIPGDANDIATIIAVRWQVRQRGFELANRASAAAREAAERTNRALTRLAIALVLVLATTAGS